MNGVRAIVGILLGMILAFISWSHPLAGLITNGLIVGFLFSCFDNGGEDEVIQDKKDSI